MRSLLVSLLLSAAIALIGCGPSESSEGPVATPPAEQRVNELVKKSGGRWDALSEADRQELVQSLGRGDERSARVSFEARNPKAGPPAPGRP